jgi:hypothetical protein
MRHIFFENIDFSIGEEGAVGTEYSQSSWGGEKIRWRNLFAAGGGGWGGGGGSSGGGGVVIVLKT